MLCSHLLSENTASVFSETSQKTRYRFLEGVRSPGLMGRLQEKQAFITVLTSLNYLISLKRFRPSSR